MLMNTLAQSGTVQQRSHVFAALVVRNRVIEVLRYAVPAFGIVIFGGFVLQLYLGSLGHDFGFSDISIDRNNLVVDTPAYSSVGVDGSFYGIEAASARTALDRTDIIDLSHPVLTLRKAEGNAITVEADTARVETTSQQVTVEGITRLFDTAGMNGTVVGMSANLATETMVGKGPVDITFPNGATLTAASMSYDGTSATWGFQRAVLTLPSTPGDDQSGSGQADQQAAGELAAAPVAPAALGAPRPAARPPGLELR